ncbi:MAG: dihydropteroate synthase, partial [Planctomycetes bacterium]|nr:dihydropteroate synthase [Planctomycetota bacterium]
FSEKGLIHVMNHRGYHQGTDPFTLFQKLISENTIDPHNAFYLGFEMAKALTALTLHKNYCQDQPLQWGFLTRDEAEHHPFETE